MLPYSSLYTRAGDNSLLRVLGGVLALLSIVLALLGIIFHQGVADLIIGVVVGIFALRVLILWLGDKAQSPQNGAMQKPYPNVVYTTRPSSQTLRYAGQPAPYAAQYEQQPVSYAAPYARPQSFYQDGTQVIQPSIPKSPVESAPTPPKLPRSIRPQRPPMPEAPFPTRFIESAEPIQPVPVLPVQSMQSMQPMQPVQPMEPVEPLQPVQPVQPVQLPYLEQQREMQQPVSGWLTPADASVPVLLPAPRPLPDSSAHWQYDDGSDLLPRGREEMSDDGTA